MTKTVVGTSPMVFSMTEKMFFVAKKLLSEAAKFFSTSEKKISVA